MQNIESVLRGASCCEAYACCDNQISMLLYVHVFLYYPNCVRLLAPCLYGGSLFLWHPKCTPVRRHDSQFHKHIDGLRTGFSPAYVNWVRTEVRPLVYATEPRVFTLNWGRFLKGSTEPVDPVEVVILTQTTPERCVITNASSFSEPFILF